MRPPFANGCQIQLHIKAPVAIMRQVFKHKVGTVESEVSRRYVTEQPEVFSPDWRRATDNVKQGSGDEHCVPSPMSLGVISEDGASTSVQIALGFYNHLLDQGVCPELARFVLPQSFTTVTYGEARDKLGQEFQEGLRTHDICDLSGKGGSCGDEQVLMVGLVAGVVWMLLRGPRYR